VSRPGGGLFGNPAIAAFAIACVLASSAASQEIPALPDGGAIVSEPAAPSTGTLDVLSTPPGVSVEVDGVSEGVTPLVGIVLVPGEHHLRLRSTGLKTQERTIDIAAGQNLHVSFSLPAVPTESPSFLGSGWDVPLASAILAGGAAALFGVGLGFGIAANDVQHQAGGNVSSSGVDLGLTRAQAVQGKQYAITANTLYVGAAVALTAAVIVAVVQPPHHVTEPAAESGQSQGNVAASPSTAAWAFW
jgi:hypothetical protein